MFFGRFVQQAPSNNDNDRRVEKLNPHLREKARVLFCTESVMTLTKSLLFAILTHLDFSNDVYNIGLIASADWILPSAVAFCLGVVIALRRK